MSYESFRKVIRAGLYNPGILPKRLKDMVLALNRKHEERSDDFLLPFIEVLEKEIEAYERLTADKAQDPNSPTRETVRKLREDPVLFLLARGTINKDDQKAIEEIRELRFKLTMGLTAGGGGGGGEKVDTSTKTYVHPVERLTVRQDALYVHVYKPWAAAHNKGGIRLGKKGRVLELNQFNLVVSVVEDGVPLTKLEGEHRVRNGSLSKPFTRAIRKFADDLRKAEHEGSVPRSNGG